MVLTATWSTLFQGSARLSRNLGLPEAVYPDKQAADLWGLF